MFVRRPFCMLFYRLLHTREDILELVKPCLLVLLDHLLLIVNDLDLILRQETDRRIHIVTHRAAMQLRCNNTLRVLARNEIDKLLRIFHILCVLDDVDAVWLGDNAFLHVDKFYGCTVRNVFCTALFESQTNCILTVRNSHIHGRGAGEKLAVEVA